MRRSLRSPHCLLYAAAGAALLFAPGCSKEEGPGKLFEEDGVWSLTQYNLDGDGLTTIDNGVRGDAFMMKFTAESTVVQLAMCGETEMDTPGNSQCKLLPNDTAWFCRCYAYAYEEDVMYWREFAAGETPPMVEFPDENAPASSTAPATSGGGDTDTDGGSGGAMGDTGGSMAGGDVMVQLGALPDITSTYQFRPLPVGNWGSDGSISSYVMQQKANSVFDQALDDPDGRPSCQPCI